MKNLHSRTCLDTNDEQARFLSTSDGSPSVGKERSRRRWGCLFWISDSQEVDIEGEREDLFDALFFSILFFSFFMFSPVGSVA